MGLTGQLATLICTLIALHCHSDNVSTWLNLFAVAQPVLHNIHSLSTSSNKRSQALNGLFGKDVGWSDHYILRFGDLLLQDTWQVLVDNKIQPSFDPNTAVAPWQTCPDIIPFNINKQTLAAMPALVLTTLCTCACNTSPATVALIGGIGPLIHLLTIQMPQPSAQPLYLAVDCLNADHMLLNKDLFVGKQGTLQLVALLASSVHMIRPWSIIQVNLPVFITASTFEHQILVCQYELNGQPAPKPIGLPKSRLVISCNIDCTWSIIASFPTPGFTDLLAFQLDHAHLLHLQQVIRTIWL